jgi:HAE1 family hydrophobic/amphiphilic exporter-1
VSLKLQNNASLAATTDKTLRAESFINSLPEARFFEHVVSSIGGSDTDQSLFKSQISVQMKDLPDRPSTNALANKIRDYLKTESGAEYSVLSARQAFGPEPLEAQVRGPDFSTLMEIAEKIRARAEKIPGVESLSLSTEMGRPELRLAPVRWRAARLGVEISGLAQIVRGYLNGNTAGTFREGGAEYDIKVRLDPAKTGDIYAIGSLPVMTKFGAVALEEMANLEWGDSPTEIRRVERERTLAITGNIGNIPLGDVVAPFQAILDDIGLPPGYSARITGEAEELAESSAMMGQTIMLAVAVTFLVIASILESWAYALIILFSVPMTAIGVVPLMMATGANISILAMIGMVMLVGLVVNNAIIVVDYAEILRRGEGLPPDTAIEKSCEVRFKSIAMGVATSIVSFLPLAIATGRGSEFRWPIAVVAIGGLLAGGMLALLAIPAAYKIYWAARDSLSRRRGGAPRAPQSC